MPKARASSKTGHGINARSPILFCVWISSRHFHHQSIQVVARPSGCAIELVSMLFLRRTSPSP
jgi:hypothetical protein